MNSDEARLMLRELENKIRTQLEEFERVSTFKIDSIEIGHYISISAIPEYDNKPHVNVHIKVWL